MSAQTIRTTERPNESEFADYYAGYIALVPDGDILERLHDQQSELGKTLENVTADESLVLHAPYTWTLRQVMGHMADTERIFGYRANRFLAGDATPLPGFDENQFVAAADFNRIDLRDLVREWQVLREANLMLFRRAKAPEWTFAGNASGFPVTPRALAWMIAGHVEHHLAIIRKRLGHA